MIPYLYLSQRCQHGILRKEPCFQCKRDPARSAKFEAEFLARQKRVSSADPGASRG